MNKIELYEIEDELCKKAKQIESEQKKYVEGVYKGIELTVKAVRDHLTKEHNDEKKV